MAQMIHDFELCDVEGFCAYSPKWSILAKGQIKWCCQFRKQLEFHGGNTMRRIGWKRVQSDLSKGRPINLRLKKHVPELVVADMLKRWGQWIEIGTVDDEWVSLSNDSGFQEFVQKQTPGAWLAGLRGAHGLTQKELGEKLGNVTPARISDWEHDRRAVSKTIAKQLAVIFRVNAELFL